MNNFNPILLQFLALVFSEFIILSVFVLNTSSEEDFD